MFVPLNARRLLVVDTLSRDCCLAGADLGSSPAKYHSACAVPSCQPGVACVIAAPASAQKILHITVNATAAVAKVTGDDDAGNDRESVGGGGGGADAADDDPQSPRKSKAKAKPGRMLARAVRAFGGKSPTGGLSAEQEAASSLAQSGFRWRTSAS